MQRTLILLLAVIFTLGGRMSAELLLHYSFDETSGDALDTGSSPAANSTLNGTGIGRTTDVPGGWGGNALNLGAGRSGGENNYTSTGSVVSKLNGLTAMTMTMWINVQSALTAGDRIFSNSLVGTNGRGMDLYFDTVSSATNNFSLTLSLYNSSGTSSTKSTSATTLNANDKWLFVAFVFDGTAQTIRAYYGDEATAIVQSGNAAANTISALGTTTKESRLGSYVGTTESRTPPAYINDFRIYNTALTSAELETIRHRTPPIYDYTFSYTSNGNTMALYHFDEGSGTNAVDASNNANTITVPVDEDSAWIPQGQSVKFGKSAFESYSSAISAPDSASFDSLTNNMTIEAWLYIPEDATMATSEYRGLITKMTSGVNDGFCLAFKGTGAAISESVALYFQIGDTILSSTLSTGLPIGEWFHIAAVLDSTSGGDSRSGGMSLYLNGQLAGQLDTPGKSITANNVDLRLNTFSGASQKIFDIVYDEVRISNIAMEPSHVTLNVLDFVEGDGVTDDSVALQDAFDEAAAQQATLQIPANCTIRVTRNMFLHGQCHLEGAGDSSIILCDADLDNDHGRGYWICTGITEHKDDGGTWDCYSGTIRNLCFKASENAKFGRCIFAFHTAGLTISDVLFDFQDGISIVGACLFGATESGNNANWAPGANTISDIKILNNEILADHCAGGGSEGFGLGLADGVVISDNYIYGVGDDPIACHTCEDIVIQNNECYSIDGRILLTFCTRGRIVNNYCTRIPEYGTTWYGTGAFIWLGLEGNVENPATNNVEISHNIIEVPSQIPDYVYGIRLMGARDVVVTENYLIMNSSNGGGGIRIEQDAQYSSWIDPTGLDTDGIARPRNITVKNNVCEGIYPGGIAQTGPGSSLPGPYYVRENIAGSYYWYTSSSSVWNNNIIQDGDYTKFCAWLGAIEDPDSLYVDSLTNVRPSTWTNGTEYTAAKAGKVLGYNIQLSETITAGWITLYFYKNDNEVCHTTIQASGQITLNGELTGLAFQPGDRLSIDVLGSSGLLPNSGINVTATVYALQTTLAAYYKFNENTGSTTSDSSGNGNDGTITGASWTSGIMGTALQFDGNDEVVVDDHDSLDITDNMSISFWINATDYPSGYAAFPVKKTSSTSGFVCYYFGTTGGINMGKIGFMKKDSGTTIPISAYYTLPQNEWVHVALVYTSTDGGQLYINGEPYGIKTGSGTISIHAEDMEIGLYLLGMLDDLRIYNRALTADEIQKMYDATLMMAP